MSTRILFSEFRDENAATRYPFVDPSLMVTLDGYAIPLGAFVDAALYPSGAVAPLWLSKITIAPHQIAVEISDALRNVVATATFDPTGTIDTATVYDPQGRPAGVLVFAPETAIAMSAWPAGDHGLDQAAAVFLATCTFPNPSRGVEAIVDASGAAYDGEVWLVGGAGVVLSMAGPRVIRVDAVGDPLFARALCSPAGLFTTPNPLRTINGCPPDANGDFQLTPAATTAPQTLLRIVPADGALTVELAGAEGPPQ